MERFEFLGAKEAFGELDVEERGGGLGADAFEEIEIFGGKWNAGHAVSEGDEAEKAAGSDKRDGDAAAAFCEMVRVEVFEINDPRNFRGVEVDRFVGDLSVGDGAKAAAPGLENFVGDVFGERSRGAESELLFLFVKEKNSDRENVEGLRGETGYFTEEVFAGDKGGSPFGEESPEGSVVVEWSK